MAVNIGTLKQGDTIVFANGKTALVCKFYHANNDINSWRGEYIIHYYVNHDDDRAPDIGVRYYFSNGEYRSNYEEWTPSQFDGLFIVDIIKG